MPRTSEPPTTAKSGSSPAGGDRGRRRGPRKGDVKEDAILETAGRLLADKPISAITIDEIAQGAGISRPTFYFYFDSRDAVARTLASRVADRWVGAIAGAFDNSVDPAVAVRTLSQAFVSMWRTDGPVLRAMASLYENDIDMRSFWDGITESMLTVAAGAIDAEREAGRALPAPPDARDLARVMSAMLWRVGYETSLTPPSADGDARVVDTLTAVILRSVYGIHDPFG